MAEDLASAATDATTIAAPETTPVTEAASASEAQTESVTEPLPSETVAEASADSAESTSAIEAATEAAPEAPAEPPKAEAASETPAEPAQPEPLVYQDFMLPEGMTVPEERMNEFKTLAGGLRIPQEEAQKFLDLHAGIVRQTQEAMDQRQRDVFAETRRAWVKDVDKTYGNRRDTVLGEAKWAIGELVKDETQRRELYDVLAFSGVGDHKAVINAFASAARRLRERAAPPTDLPPKGAPQTAADRRYGAPRS